MDKELEKYYEERFDLFSMPAWGTLMDEIDAMIDATDRISVVKSQDDLQFKRGELSIMKWVKGLKEMTEIAYKELNDEPSGDV